MNINICVVAIDNQFDLLGIEDLLVEYRKGNISNKEKIIWFHSIVELI